MPNVDTEPNVRQLLNRIDKLEAKKAVLERAEAGEFDAVLCSLVTSNSIKERLPADAAPLLGVLVNVANQADANAEALARTLISAEIVEVAQKIVRTRRKIKKIVGDWPD